MENASKALLMAGGMLIALLTISLLVLMFTRISAVQRTNNVDEAEMTTTEFNNQFSTYNNDHVRGSELYSCLNRAVDYNKTVTTVSEDGKNWRDSQYEPIEIHLDFSEKEELLFDKDSVGNQIFTHSDYDLKYDRDTLRVINDFEELIGKVTYNSTTNSWIIQKNNTIEGLETYYTKSIISKLTTEISSIFSGPDTGPNANEKNIQKLEAFENIVGNVSNLSGKIPTTSYQQKQNYREESTDVVEHNLNILRYGMINTGSTTQTSKLYKDVSAYFEYTQFKRAIFECTECIYSQNTGRITKLSFEFTGNFN